MFEGGNVGTDEWSGWLKAGLGAEPVPGLYEAYFKVYGWGPAGGLMDFGDIQDVGLDIGWVGGRYSI